jgi:YggT family protein
MLPLLQFVDIVLDFIKWVIILGAVLSWLIAFNIVNRSNPVVRGVWDFLTQVTEPIYKPIRRMLPRTGAFDFAPLIVIFIILFIQIVVLGNLRMLSL